MRNEQTIPWEEIESLVRQVHQDDDQVLSEDENYYLDKKISNLKNQILKIKDTKRELKRREQRKKEFERIRIRNQKKRERIKREREKDRRSKS